VKAGFPHPSRIQWQKSKLLLQGDEFRLEAYREWNSNKYTHKWVSLPAEEAGIS
jgi:hypothetical protein